MDTVLKDTVEVLPDEVNLFAPVYQSLVLLNEFDQDFSPLAAIQAGAPIEFTVTGKDQHYLDLNDSYLTVRAKMTTENGGATTAHHVGPVNLPLHSMFKEISAKVGNREVCEPNTLYPYRAYMETLLSFTEEVQNTRLIAEGWKKDSSTQINYPEPDGPNTGLAGREDAWNVGRTTELVGRPHIDISQQARLVPPKVDFYLKLVPAPDSFVIMSNQQNPAYKLAIVSVTLTVRMKQLTNEAELAHHQLLKVRPMRLAYTRVQMRQFTIAAGLLNVSFDDIFTGALPDLIVVGMVNQAAFVGSYTENPFNFQNFNLRRMEVKRNGLSVPRDGYKPDFSADSTRYMRAYRTFLNQLGYHKVDKCISITPAEWANGYNLYPFKITDGDIGNGTDEPRNRANTGSLKLEIDFAAATPGVVKVVIYAQSPGFYEFDEFKNVVVS